MPRRAKVEGVIRRSGRCNHLYSDVRAEPDFSRNFKLICPVQTSPKKYSAFVVGQISATSSPHPARTRGVSRSSRTWGEMRWTRMRSWRTACDADGEVVWSCSPVLFSSGKEREKLIKIKIFGDLGSQRKRPARTRQAQ